MMLRLAAAILLASVVQAHAEAAPKSDSGLAGCWEMRDTKAEIARRAEDPFYANAITYCFDEGGPGQLVTRAAEFSGYRDDAGNWVNGGGDGWDQSGTYALVGDQMHIDDQMSVEICRFALKADVLTLTDCAIQDGTGHAEIEDTSYDRASN